jgi:RNA polymerase sigma-70 factor (ECF subfamily)
MRHPFDLGRAAWPDLVLDFDAFQRSFGRHFASESPPNPAYAQDIYLACACATGVHGAALAFDRTHAGVMAAAVASVDASPAFVDEILQDVRERLLVPKEGRAPKIAEYAGRASLKSWLSAVAVRAAISRRRRMGDRRHDPFTNEGDRRLASDSPELACLRNRYKDVFEHAVRSAIERLCAKDRMLLRLNVVDGMSVDKLARAYGVGRSTAARWLASARATLFDQVRSEIRRTVPLTSSELESLGAAIGSQLDVSVGTLLAATR